jgi:hydroxymethylpyrimidine pyrophosphatase-like HAD family hydrolase
MLPLDRFSRDDARALSALLFDLDDTVLTDGVLTREAYGALWDLRASGLALFAATGRPSGWAEIVARQWPVAGALAENGAILLLPDDARGTRRVRIDGALDDATRTRRDAIVDRVRAAFPELSFTDDMGSRISDVTFDIGEHVTVPHDRVEAARALAHSLGARTSISSVHLHITLSGDDKASGAFRLLGRVLGLDAGAARARAAFVGDSGNDAACFAAFKHTFGVANVERWVSRLSVPPRFVTTHEKGAGFAELTATLCRLRA